MEGGKKLDYRIEQMREQRFIALVKSFANEIINDDENHEIPDFWAECHQNNLVEALRELRPQGKMDLYGLCSPTQNGEKTFDYGIGVILNEDTVVVDEETMLKAGYKIWNVAPETYAVFKCIGENGDCISDMWSRFYKEFLPQMGYEAMDSTDYEIYFENGEPRVFCELWIPVKKITY